MKVRILIIVLIIMNSILPAQPQIPQLKDTNLEKYYNLLNERFLFDGNTSFNGISSFFYRNNFNRIFESPSSIWKIKSYTYQFWNSGNWQNDSSEVYSYNQNNLISERKIRDWSGSQWVDKYRHLFLYNTSLKISTETKQFYLGGSWYDSLKKVYDYDSQGLLSTRTSYRWTNSGWENWELVTSTYSNSRLVEDIHQDWNEGTWENSSRTTYEYTNDYTSATFSFWLFGTWINLLRIVFYYDTNGLISEFRLQIWDFISPWTNLTRILFTYDSNYNLVEGLRQDWDFDISAWINYSKITTTYDSQNLPRTDLTELWTENGNWVKSFLSTHDYDSNKNRTETIGQHWSGSNWLNSIRELFTYTDVSPVETTNSKPDEFKLIGNYPNPFNPSTTIKFYVPETSIISLKIYNSIGEEVAILLNQELVPGSYEIEWNADNFTSGVYYYQMISNEFVETKKMILLK